MAFNRIKIEGNNKTNAMHLHCFHELNRMHVRNELPLKFIHPEQTVILSSFQGLSPRKGKFDFLVETMKGKLIGFEVLTRPSKGKMKEKLAYANEVDEFVFVLPHDAMQFYQKPKTKVFHKKCRLKYFGNEFSSSSLKAWMFNLRDGRFTEKSSFNKVFCVKK